MDDKDQTERNPEVQTSEVAINNEAEPYGKAPHRIIDRPSL